MMRLVKVGLVLAALTAVPMIDAAAQFRGVGAIGLAVPIGEFADEADWDAQAGGMTGLVGVEWMPTGSAFGLRVDGAYQKFCTSLCDEESGDLDIGYRFLNANLNGVLEFPMGTGGSISPYFIGGVGIYEYKLVGDDTPEGTEGVTDFGLNGGVGLTYHLEDFGVFGEARLHTVFGENIDLQYIPIMIGARITFR
jgi:hypothetical protein